MTSSSDVAADVAPDELPGSLTSMWRLFKLGYHHEPRLLVTAFVLSLLAAVPDALIALWLALLGKGAVEGNDTLVMVAAIGLGVSATLTWLLRVISSRLQRRFRDRVTIALETGSPCYATRSSCSTTCTCRCSRRAGGSSGSR